MCSKREQAVNVGGEKKMSKCVGDVKIYYGFIDLMICVNQVTQQKCGRGESFAELS